MPSLCHFRHLVLDKDHPPTGSFAQGSYKIYGVVYRPRQVGPNCIQTADSRHLLVIVRAKPEHWQIPPDVAKRHIVGVKGSLRHAAEL